MAGAIVHKKFFKECIEQSKIKDIDNINNLNIFAQGHDLLLYASPINFFKNRKISLLLSNHNFKDFVYTYLKISVENGSVYKDKSVKSFYTDMCHITFWIAIFTLSLCSTLWIIFP